MDNKKIDLGHISGKTLLFGGVYSNLQALEALKKVSEKEGIPAKNCICTGDIVGYCAQPEETVQFFKEWGAKSIVGNVEIQLRENANDCGCDFRAGSKCDNLSQLWYPFAKSKLSSHSLGFIKEMPNFIKFTYANKKVLVVHGSLFNVSEFIFKSTDWSIKERNFKESNSDLIIAGHCGLPFIDTKNNKIWLNPGVIGMPANNGKPTVWYAILETKNREITITHKKLAYDYKLTNQLMLTKQLPKEYAKTILTGIWDNTEILPPIESANQGKKISF